MSNMTGKSYAAALRRRLLKVAAQPCKGKGELGQAQARARLRSGPSAEDVHGDAARPERPGLQGSSESSQRQGCGLKLKPGGPRVLSCEGRSPATQARVAEG